MVGNLIGSPSPEGHNPRNGMKPFAKISCAIGLFEGGPEGRNPRKGIIIQKPMEVSYDSES